MVVLRVGSGLDEPVAALRLANEGDQLAGIAELTGKKVHLFLHVKVKEDWAEDRAVYRDSGLDWVD